MAVRSLELAPCRPDLPWIEVSQEFFGEILKFLKGEGSAIGVEQFRPMPGAKPTCGEVGRTERVPTVRVEFAIPRDPDLLVRVLTRGLIPHHPWEQPAIFIDESQATISHARED